MLSEEQLQVLMQKILGLYERMEDDLLSNIAKRFTTSEEITPDTVLEWQVKKLQELGALRKENLELLAKYSDKTLNEIIKIITDAGFMALETDEEIYETAHKEGKLEKKPMPAKMSPVLKQIVQGAISNTKEYFNMINTTALETSKKGFLDIINQTYLETSLGITDYNTAIRKAVRNLADKGITGATYISKNGKVTRNHIDVAVRRAILTSTSQTAGEMQIQRAKEWGSNLVEVTSHSGSRPEHARWQGKVYSLEGGTSRYPNLKQATRYGEVDGLKGVNCKHDFYPYFAGISERTYKPYPLRENKEKYEQSQKQRYLEREVRKQKRRVLMAEEIGDTELKQNAQLKLKERERQLKAFTKETGRTRRRNREQVLDFGHSEATKAVWADRKNR